MTSELRVRFAPSPTGYLHIGGVRTALFSWLWARKNGGVFVLRIEDTDLERSTEQSVGAIVESLRWLNLDWDEGPEVGGPFGPYFQSQRLELYRRYSERLIASGNAYRCYCTKDDLAAARAAHTARGDRTAFRYPGTCKGRTEQPDAPFVVRFNAPSSGTTGWADLVKGRIDVPNDTQQDFVLLRSDGVPLYNFGCVVDDSEMNISLVTRGDDHIVNTAPQILIYEALQKSVPTFAHLPMILAPNGEKLSKRHAAVNALEYRDQGYLPDAVLNYLARLGWSHGDQEIFSRQELIEKFSWDHVGSNAGRYDAKKFLYVQASHLRSQTDEHLATLAIPWLEKKGLPTTNATLIQRSIATAKARASTLADLAEAIDFYLVESPVIDDKAKAKFLTPEQAPRLQELHNLIEQVEPFDEATLEAQVKAWLESKGYAMKDVAQPSRVALTGRTTSPGLFEMMAVLGKQPTLQRLAHAVAVAHGQTP
jgi:glutamyl-tRNA synthetase